MLELVFGKHKIYFERIVSRSKNIITIQVDCSKKVIVKSPPDLTDEELIKIIKTKTLWILNKFQVIDQIKRFDKNREFVSGESFPYKGKLLRLKVIQTDEIEDVYSDTTTIFCKTKNVDPKRVYMLLESWYKKEANEYLKKRVVLLSSRFKKKPTKIIIKSQKLRWGSCTKKDEILLNWRIIMAPPSVIDYVIIHELVHLQEKNHNKAFWELLKSAMPNYQEKKEWLKLNGRTLTLSFDNSSKC